MNSILKKSKRYRSVSTEARKNDWHVVRETTGWVVRRCGAARASGVYATQAEAEKAAKEIVRIKGGGVILVQGRDGRYLQSFTLGRSSFAKISAVEGIRLSREMERDFQEFDRKGLSSSERRRAIVSKYGRKPA